LTGYKLLFVILIQQAYLFNDYWEDIGNIKSFFDANLALTAQVSLIVIVQSMHSGRTHWLSTVEIDGCCA
jgi:ADP-glucose pyrophosphorylase